MTASTATIITTNRCHPIFRNNFILFVNFILFCTVPLISCKNDGKGNGVDASGELRKQLISSHNIEHSNSEWKSEKAENEELHPQLFAAYHESYITKAAAKDFRKKIRSHKKPITEQDYNDLLQEIVLKPIDKPKNDIYEKKYFDYLPAEDEIDFDADDDSNDYRFGFDGTTNDGDDLTGYDELSDEENENLSETMIHKNRYKRDIKDDSERLIQNEKRHAVWDQGHHQTAPLTFYISRERQQPINPFIFGTAVYNDLNPNNPWNNRFYGSPHLNNFYLPVAPPPSAGYAYPRPVIPFSIIVPGPYHNIPDPPQNPQATEEPAAPSTDSPVSLDNRFGEPVWDVDDVPQVNQNSISNIGKDNSVQPPTKRPSPPLIHNSDQERDIPRPERPQRPQSTQGTNQQGTPPATTRRPQPSLIHNSDSQNALDLARPSRIPTLGSNRQGGSAFTVGPSVGAPIWSSDDGQTQSNRPAFAQQQPQQIDAPVAQLGPSRCVWGIVNCCTRRDINIRYACFERIGCQGAFWDLNPCGDDILDAALNEADRYFN
ncbi:uncharacterized protein LOC119085108 isoform X2 [Bradysia coprophila]|uniref:uncharacterized protein LOC119085108 isoform X2 n=1 Tax=Bradysia coprophila TaxID=38358 RepID=UPI00187D71C4|nr:uncharacterized protein LOC119085108 isoform X2 [Bradysia coprophila]